MMSPKDSQRLRELQTKRRTQELDTSETFEYAHLSVLKDKMKAVARRRWLKILNRGKE